jgi:hypothetical protein
MKQTLLALLVVLAPALAVAGEERVVSHARLSVADVAPSAPAAIGSVDLGPAPPPGGTRLLPRTEVEDRVRAAGLDPAALRLPKVVRIVGASQRLSPDALAKMASGAIARALPEGVTLRKIEPAHDIVTRPGTTVKTATVAKLPRQKGEAHSTATLELATDDDVSTKIPVAITVEVSEAAAKADVPRGARVDLVIERGAVRIVTAATATADAEVGDTGNVSVVSTGRVVRARFVTRDRADLVDLR